MDTNKDNTLLGDNNNTDDNKNDNNVNDNKDNKVNDNNDVNNNDDKKQDEDKKDLEYQFDIPEGIQVEEESINKFKEIAKKHGIKPEVAKELLNIEIENIKRQEENIVKMREEWKKETLKELGLKAEEQLAYAKNVLKYADEDFIKILDETGLGNHKSVVKFFIELGKRMSEDFGVDGRSSTPEQKEKSLAERLYPSES